MSQETLASIEGTADRVRQFIEKTSLLGSGSDPYHEEIYVHIKDGQVDGLASSAGNSSISYCSFAQGGYLDSVESEQDEGTEAIIDVSEFLSFFDWASNGKKAHVRFLGSEDDDLANKVVIESKFKGEVMLPASQSIKEKVPLGVVERFKDGEKWDNHVFYSNSGNEPTTEVKTSASSLADIKDGADITGKEFFPIVVDDEEFQIVIEQETGGSRGSGSIEADTQGMDVDNNYLHGFEELTSSLNGDIILRTAPDAPMSVIKDGDGYVLRHILAPVQ